jgi:hypothetical protein
MSEGIFVRRGDELIAMSEQQYELEDHLQELLSRHPDLLAGGQMNREDPRRWLLVSREAGLPSEQDGSARWSVDHLFLDQDGVPTLVEVKRSSDSRLRREVVGQLLDYAANAVATRRAAMRPKRCWSSWVPTATPSRSGSESTRISRRLVYGSSSSRTRCRRSFNASSSI